MKPLSNETLLERTKAKGQRFYIEGGSGDIIIMNPQILGLFSSC